jgi:hypothetical protein
VSSAYKASFVFANVGISLINQVKSLGPRTDPWGTPALMGCVSESVFSIFTLNFLSVMLCLGIGDRERVQSLPVPSHYYLFIDSPLFTLSTILQYYDIFPF